MQRSLFVDVQSKRALFQQSSTFLLRLERITPKLLKPASLHSKDST
ncbi:hypothetical protein X777_04568 [Ooceraea biroi]|uniref:Uncharacterized protein n=1 Tax=Ooceraea biroi TaxID=2015173 RepID=A0A026WHJ6_OOCBI|nr:hypothetical protein X777_04568 [Ooceraea biroi]